MKGKTSSIPQVSPLIELGRRRQGEDSEVVLNLVSKEEEMRKW